MFATRLRSINTLRRSTLYINTGALPLAVSYKQNEQDEHIITDIYRDISISAAKMLISHRFFLALAAVHGVFSTPVFSNSTVDRSNLTVALVRSPPPNWPLPITNYDYTGINFNISEAVDAGIKLINEAKSNGSDLVVFPELWFPG